MVFCKGVVADFPLAKCTLILFEFLPLKVICIQRGVSYCASKTDDGKERFYDCCVCFTNLSALILILFLKRVAYLLITS